MKKLNGLLDKKIFIRNIRPLKIKFLVQCGEKLFALANTEESDQDVCRELSTGRNLIGK